MEKQHATVLRNYAKRVVLPVLGLQGTYQEDESVDEDPSTCKWALDLGESLVHSLYKKPKIDSDLVEFNNEAAEMEDEGSRDSENEDKLYSEDSEGGEENWIGRRFTFLTPLVPLVSTNLIFSIIIWAQRPFYL